MIRDFSEIIGNSASTYLTLTKRGFQHTIIYNFVEILLVLFNNKIIQFIMVDS